MSASHRLDARAPAVPVVALVVAALALLPFYRWHLTPDGISYLSIAQHYADGDLTDAVNAYWSPLFSWLLVLPLAVGLPATITAKLVNIAVAALLLSATRRLARAVGVGEPTLTLLSWGLVPFLLGAAFVVVTPDLLVALLVVAFITLVVQPGYLTRAGVAVGAGVLAGLAYLAKLYALPFVLALLPVVAVILRWRGHGLRVVLRQTTATALVFLAVVAAWSAVLTATSGELTVGTAGGLNVRYLGANSGGAPSQWAGFIAPPHDEAVSIWEDPASAPQLERSSAVSDPASDPERGAGVVDLLRNAVGNLGELLLALAWWAPVVGLALAWPWLRRRRVVRRRSRAGAVEPPREPALIVAAAAAIWTGGLLLTYPQQRYLWTALLLAMPLAGLAVDAARRRPVGRDTVLVLGALLAVGLVPAGVANLVDVWRESDDVPEVAAAIGSDVSLADRRIASNGSWAGMLGLCLELDCRYYGVPAPAWDEREVTEALTANDIEYFVSVGGALPGPAPAAAVPDEGVYVYEVADLRDR